MLLLKKFFFVSFRKEFDDDREKDEEKFANYRPQKASANQKNGSENRNGSESEAKYVLVYCY